MTDKSSTGRGPAQSLNIVATPRADDKIRSSDRPKRVRSAAACLRDPQFRAEFPSLTAFMENERRLERMRKHFPQRYRQYLRGLGKKP